MNCSVIDLMSMSFVKNRKYFARTHPLQVIKHLDRCRNRNKYHPFHRATTHPRTDCCAGNTSTPADRRVHMADGRGGCIFTLNLLNATERSVRDGTRYSNNWRLLIRTSRARNEAPPGSRRRPGKSPLRFRSVRFLARPPRRSASDSVLFSAALARRTRLAVESISYTLSCT